MERKPATLDGIQGEGYAEITTSRTGMKRCDGVFYNRSSPDISGQKTDNPNPSSLSTFSGVVYERGRKHQLTFEVRVTNITLSDSADTDFEEAIYFTSNGDPFTG